MYVISDIYIYMIDTCMASRSNPVEKEKRAKSSCRWSILSAGRMPTIKEKSE